MDYAYRMIKNVKYFYSTINSANVSGAIDVVVVEQPDGEYKSTPFHVRFGKYGVFNHLNKYVDIAVNGEEIDVKMKLADSGVAFFVEEVDDSCVPEYLITSPLPEQKNNNDTDQVLFESAKKLQEVQSKAAGEIASRRNTVPEDEAEGNRAGTGIEAGSRDPAEEQSLSQVQRKKTLPFSSSVFSDRKYRSLPDLSSISESNLGHVSDSEGMTQFTVRKKTPPRKYSYFPNSKTAFPMSEKRRKADRAEEFEEFRKNRRAYRKAKEEKEQKRREVAEAEANEAGNEQDKKDAQVERKKSKVTFGLSNPIEIAVDDSDNESSVSSSLSSSPSHSPSAVDDSKLDERDRIADGALSDSEIDKHRERNQPEPHDVTDWKWGEIPQTREQQTQKKQDEKEQQENSSSSYWWFWSRSSKPAKGEEKKTEGISLDQLLSNAQSDPVAIEKYIGKTPSTTMSVDSGNVSRGVSQPASPTSVSGMNEVPIVSSDRTTPMASPSSEKTPTLENVSLNDASRLRPSQPMHTRVRSSSEQKSQSSDEIFPLSEDELLEDFIDEASHKRYVRSLRLSSDKLKSLQLVRGANECRFSITTRFQGTTWCSCNIYLYKWYEQIVISDIDGTITKSDVLGHVIPAIGGTWAHAGVAELYTRIKNNGYKMVYLSSRAIGQSHTTKQYLKSIAQDSRQLPDGPVLLSPTSILTAFRREVIERRPEEFKIAALNDLKQLFPNNPFYAGFGNRETDVKSYRAVDVPFSRIFIIDPSGRVKRSDSVGYVSSYARIASETVDYIFPPLIRVLARSEDEADEQERYNLPWSKPLEHSDFTHWNSTVDNGIEPVLGVTDQELGLYEAGRKLSMEVMKKKK